MNRERPTARTLIFTGPRQVGFRDEPVAPPGPRDVRIEALHSGISRGTEMSVYRGTAPYFAKAYAPDAKLFLAGRMPSWSYPMSFGYEHVGRVVEVGAKVEGFDVGDVVYTPSAHAESLTMSTTETGPFFGSLVPILKLPADLDPQLGLFLPLLGVAYNAMLDGGPMLGETVAVFGAGVVGLLAVQLARLAGAEHVVIVEPIAARRELARRFGATHDFDPTPGRDVALAVRELTAGRGADLAFEASGYAAALHESIRTVGYNGRVVVTSYHVGSAAGICLGEEFHHNRVRLISSQSFGVSPGVSDRWDPARRTLAALALLPRLELAPMITHRFPFADAARAFQLLDEQPDAALQIVLDYAAE